MSLEAAVLENTATLKTLIELIRSGSSLSTSTLQSSTDVANQIWWQDPSTPNSYGVVESEAEFKKVKKASPKAIKIPESKYNSLVSAADGDNGDGEEGDGDGDGDDAEAEAAATAAAEKAKKAAAAKAKKDAAAVPSEQDVIDLFSKYLPTDLEKPERANRAAIIKPILASFDAPKATALKPEDRKAAMDEVTEKMEAYLTEAADEDGLV